VVQQEWTFKFILLFINGTRMNAHIPILGRLQFDNCARLSFPNGPVSDKHLTKYEASMVPHTICTPHQGMTHSIRTAVIYDGWWWAESNVNK
jgi:hypothetical protein